MKSKAMWCAVVAAMVIGAPAVASAQVQTMKDFQVADVGDMGGKFVALAGAFDEAMYDWEPMEGVRSVRQVFALAVAEAHLFPSMWGATAPTGVGEGFGGEMQRVTPMSKADMVTELTRAFEYMEEAIASIDDEARMADGNTFGREMKNEAGIALAMADMHEHLGQLIAYARSNKVVPPWSARN